MLHGASKGLAAERATCIGSAAAARRVEGLAADRATGNSPGAAARHVAGRGTARHRAPPASRRSASPGSPGLILAPLATVPASRASRPIAPPATVLAQQHGMCSTLLVRSIRKGRSWAVSRNCLPVILKECDRRQLKVGPASVIKIA